MKRNDIVEYFPFGFREETSRGIAPRVRYFLLPLYAVVAANVKVSFPLNEEREREIH